MISSLPEVSSVPINHSRTPFRTALFMVLAASVGLFAAVQLLVEKVAVLSDDSYTPSCDINPVLSCGSVINTAQASVFGFPNPILGVVGFTVVIVLGVLLIARVEFPRWVWLGLNIGALLGFIFVGWLVYQSLYVIGALCPWCIVVWAAMIPLFWVITTENIRTKRLFFGSVSSITVSLRWVLAIATYVTVAGLIFVRWSDFWLSR